MDRFPRQAVLLALLEAMQERKSWCGETHIQKSAYFLEEGLGVPLRLDFILYKHGPFSFALREVLAEMKGNLLVEAKHQPPYGPSLEPTDAGKALSNRFPKTIGKHQSKIEFVSEKLSPKGVAELERLSTALYVLRERPQLDQITRATRIVELKPHVSPELAQTAVRDVDKMLSEAEHLSALIPS